MFGFMIAMEVVVAVLLIVSILMQASKGGGLAGTFGGGQVGMMFGIRRTADFLIRATQVLAGLFIVLSLLINIFFLPRTGSENVESVIQKSAPQQVPTTPQLPPAQPPLDQSAPEK
jgi:preprotein translocase subunit SecG